VTIDAKYEEADPMITLEMIAAAHVSAGLVFWPC